MTVAPNPAANPNPADAKPNLLNEAGKEAAAAPSVLSEADKEAQEAKAAEDKRLLDADPTTLSKEDQDKRTVLVKTSEEKRLLETPEDKLSAEDKVKKAELIKAQEEAEKANKVPEKYEFKAPDGIVINQAAVDKVTPIFKEIGLSQANAQKLVDAFIEIRKDAENEQAEAFKKFNDESYKATIQALGPDSKKELVYVAKVRDNFFSKETQELLDASGLSNSKEFIFDLIKLGKVLSEDQLPAGKATAGGAGKSPAEKMYPEQGK